MKEGETVNPSHFHFLTADLQTEKLPEIRINDYFEGRNFSLQDIFKVFLHILLALKMKCLMKLVYN